MKHFYLTQVCQNQSDMLRSLVLVGCWLNLGFGSMWILDSAVNWQWSNGFLIESGILVSLHSWFGGELWKKSAEDAAAARGSKEAFVLDLGASWVVLHCWPRFVCSSP
jgi:hypothetical protein